MILSLTLISLPLPSLPQIFRLTQQVGLFSPVFVIGGLMGRIFGELARWIDPFFVQFDINFEVIIFPLSHLMSSYSVPR